MRISVETTGELGRKMTVAIPADEVEQEIAARLKRLSKTARLPGFRPGKAPLKIIEAKYGSQLFQEVAGQLIERSLRDALTREGLHPAGGPEIEPKSMGRGSDLEYVASFDVFPEIKKLDLRGVTIKRPVCEVSDADVEKTIESMRKQRAEWQPVQRSAGDGDRVRMNFRGTIEGGEFAGNTAKDYAVVLGEAKILAEFEQGLRGAQAGTERTVSVSFPENYPNQEVAGKSADFSIEILEVAEAVLPGLDAELARAFGVTDGSVGKMRDEVRDNLTREVEERIARVMRQRVMEALVEVNQIELPRALVREEVHNLVETEASMRAHRGVTVAEKSDPSKFEAEARRRVALGLIVYEVVRANQLKPDEDRVRGKIEKMAAAYQDPKALVQWYYGDRKRLQQVESLVLEEQVVETLLESATIEDQSTDLDGLMSGSASTNI